MNFSKAFAGKVKATPDAAGSLIAAMRADPNLPAIFPNIRTLRAYAITSGAQADAIEAVPIVWRRYSSWLARNPSGGANGKP